MPDFHVDGSEPAEDQIFVFGSNLKGVHGAGAALFAATNLGAANGVAYGLRGKSFAIPTKGQTFQTLPIGIIEKYVTKFLMFAKQNPDMKFFVTRIGCGLAKIPDRLIAPLFEGAPDNCSFAEGWRKYLEK